MSGSDTRTQEKEAERCAGGPLRWKRGQACGRVPTPGPGEVCRRAAALEKGQAPALRFACSGASPLFQLRFWIFRAGPSRTRSQSPFFGLRIPFGTDFYMGSGMASSSTSWGSAGLTGCATQTQHQKNGPRDAHRDRQK